MWGKSQLFASICVSILLIACQAPKAKVVLPKAGEAIDVLMKQQDAWNEGDIEGYMAGYWKSDSLEFVSSKRVNHGWEQVLEGYKKSYPGKEAMGKLKFDVKSSRVLAEDCIYIIGQWTLNPGDTAEKSGHYSLLFKKINGEWKVISDHTS